MLFNNFFYFYSTLLLKLMKVLFLVSIFSLSLIKFIMVLLDEVKSFRQSSSKIEVFYFTCSSLYFLFSSFKVSFVYLFYICLRFMLFTFKYRTNNSSQFISSALALPLGCYIISLAEA